MPHDSGPERSRLLPFVGAFNFRDLGGYPTVDGRSTRWGQLFRSDALHDLTEEDLEVLRGIGLTCVIDLRTSAELERTGRGLLESEPVSYHRFSLLPETGGQTDPGPEGPDLSERYLWYLDAGHQALVHALDLVGDPVNYPLVFHCTAGKDRTGVLAALVLDILGVERAVIAEDYGLTQSRMELIMSRVRSHVDSEERMAEIPQFRLRAEVETMAKFLGLLHERFGGARAWALDAGIAPERLNTLAQLLVTDESTAEPH
jgi:protein-tyrosine phosphatase